MLYLLLACCSMRFFYSFSACSFPPQRCQPDRFALGPAVYLFLVCLAVKPASEPRLVILVNHLLAGVLELPLPVFGLHIRHTLPQHHLGDVQIQLRSTFLYFVLIACFDQRDHNSVFHCSEPPHAPRSMEVGDRVERGVVVEDVGQAANIHPSTHHLSAHKKGDSPLSGSFESFGTVCCRHIVVDASSTEALSFQHIHDRLYFLLAVHEDQRHHWQRGGVQFRDHGQLVVVWFEQDVVVRQRGWQHAEVEAGEGAERKHARAVGKLRQVKIFSG
mmetsp:Transcript_9679/g.18441  ORF Transcript_9679/g.18441 Transcript_9679/m.18441 type:complete len:274 (-) Transcript_9679:926-1747(-)